MTGKIMNTNLVDTASLLNRAEAGSRNLEKKAQDGRLREACQGFEEIFINMMLKEMRKTVPAGGLFPDSLQKDIYTSMFDQQVARQISTSRGIGIADMLYENLSVKLKDK